MVMFGSSWSDHEDRDREIYHEGVETGKEEVKIRMVSLLMDVLKCRKDHATTLVDNHLRKSQLKKKK